MTAKLGHRERVLRAFERRETDRVPIYFRAEPAVVKDLMRALAVGSEDEIVARFDADAVRATVAYAPRPETEGTEPGTYTDLLGVRKRDVRHGEITSTAIVKAPFSDASTVEDIERYAWPDRSAVDRAETVRRAEAARATGLAVYGGAWASIFTQSRDLMGEENFLAALIASPETAARLVERLTEFYLDANDAVFSACRGLVDAFYMGSDFGTQRSMFLSRDAFRRVFVPNLKRLAGQAKSFGLKTMMHSCGAIGEIIPDLIECGFDAIDPVQVSAKNMDPASLAAKFKGQVAFHGGISTQVSLLAKRPGEIREEVAETIRLLGPVGYIAGPDQNIIDDTPVENIAAMFEAIRDYPVA